MQNEIWTTISKDSVAYNTIKIDSILNARLVDFPKVNPAIKRGIPKRNLYFLWFLK
jgi:hypothetical protein